MIRAPASCSTAVFQIKSPSHDSWTRLLNHQKWRPRFHAPRALRAATLVSRSTSCTDMWPWILFAVVSGALAYGYWSHRRESSQLSLLFAVLAGEREGEVTPGSLIALPQLRFETEAARWLIGALATSGSPGGSAFTFVEANLFREVRSSDDWMRVVGVEDSLAEARLRGLKVSVKSGVVRVHRDGTAASKAEIEEMIDTADIVVAACLSTG